MDFLLAHQLKIQADEGESEMSTETLNFPVFQNADALEVSEPAAKETVENLSVSDATDFQLAQRAAGGDMFVDHRHHKDF